MFKYVNVFSFLYISKLLIFQKGVVEKYNTKFNVKLFYTFCACLLKSEKFMPVKIFKITFSF